MRFCTNCSFRMLMCIILIEVLFIIQVTCCGLLLWLHMFQWWACNVSSILLKVLLCSFLACCHSVKRIRIKQTWVLWVSYQLPGVDYRTKLSGMSAFGIPVRDRVKKPRFQNMQSWFDVHDLFITPDVKPV